MFLFVLFLKCANTTKTAFGSASKLSMLSFPLFSFAFSHLHLRGNQGQTVYQSLNTHTHTHTHTSPHSIASHPPIVFIKSCICEFPEVVKGSAKFKGQTRTNVHLVYLLNCLVCMCLCVLRTITGRVVFRVTLTNRIRSVWVVQYKCSSRMLLWCYRTTFKLSVVLCKKIMNLLCVHLSRSEIPLVKVRGN